MQNNNPRNITITGMTGDDSVQKVRTALKNVSGVTTGTVTIGLATISCGYPAAYGSACAAIVSAGYKVNEVATNLNASPTPAPGAAPESTGGQQTAKEGVIGVIDDVKPTDAPVAVEPKAPAVVAV